MACSDRCSSRATLISDRLTDDLAAGQAGEEEFLEIAADRLDADPLDELAREGVGQEALRRLFPNTAGTEVEDRVLVELADGRAVGAPDVVGVDLELWIGIRDRFGREQQVAVRLLGVRLLRALVNVDQSVEHRPRLAV